MAAGRAVPPAAGVGLRFPHHGAALAPTPGVAWLEVHPENYLDDAGARVHLLRARERLPVALHAVGLSLGSAEGVDPAALARLVALADLVEPGLVSDHLSWSTVDGTYLPDLFPLPYTDESLAVIAANLGRVQDALRRQVLVENPSVYLRYAHDAHAEAQFLAELVRRTGCGVLLDVNNVYVSSRNLGHDPAAMLEAFLAALPRAAVGEIHLAGHVVHTLPQGQQVLIDDHGSRVIDAVWALYERALAALGAVPTLIEWDTDVPAWEVLAGEAQAAQARLDRRSLSAANGP